MASVQIHQLQKFVIAHAQPCACCHFIDFKSTASKCLLASYVSDNNLNDRSLFLLGFLKMFSADYYKTFSIYFKFLGELGKNNSAETQYMGTCFLILNYIGRYIGWYLMNTQPILHPYPDDTQSIYPLIDDTWLILYRGKDLNGPCGIGSMYHVQYCWWCIGQLLVEVAKHFLMYWAILERVSTNTRLSIGWVLTNIHVSTDVSTNLLTDISVSTNISTDKICRVLVKYRWMPTRSSDRSIGQYSAHNWPSMDWYIDQYLSDYWPMYRLIYQPMSWSRP